MRAAPAAGIVRCADRAADYYPSGMTAFAIASTLVCATWTDATRSRARWPVLVYMSTCVVIASICILVWRSPTGLKFFAYCACFRYTLERGVLSGVAQISPGRAMQVKRRRSRTSRGLSAHWDFALTTMSSWANQICADDDQERGIVLASMKYGSQTQLLTVCLRRTF